MAKPHWIFLENMPGYKNREAMQGEFFSASSEIGALIRESIQNSLDAISSKSDGPVQVRIFYSGTKDALPPDKHDYYFSGGWEHFHSPGSGLAEPPERSDPCPFLVIEDFNTTGLTGDIQQDFEKKGVRNPFYYFFRAEGQSGKADQDRGRWGIGKFVFPRGSRLRSFLSVTTREDDNNTCLVGQSILKSRQIAGKNYTPDGWFGESKEGTFQLPCSDADVIRRACDDFYLDRLSRGTGLSIIIPWCEPVFNEVSEGKRLDHLVNEVVSEYFYAIISEKLTVEICTSGSNIVVDSRYIREAARHQFSELRNSIGHQRARQIALVIEWLDGKLREVSIPGEEPKNKIDWTENYIGEPAANQIRQHLEDETWFCIRVPVYVKKMKNRETLRSGLVVLISPPADGSDGRPLFIRDGLVISDVRCGLEKSVTAVVIAENSDIATLLGDAENPAHTQWNHETDKFKDKYKYGKSHLDFVRNVVKSIVRRVYKDNEEYLEDVLSDFFFLPPEDDSSGRPEKKPSGGPGPDVNPPIPPGGESRTSVRQVEGGFSVKARSENLEQLVIRAAYDRRGGNPVRKYNPLDFDFASGGFEISQKDAEIISADKNTIILKPGSPEFSVTVKGFSRERDVFVACEFEEVL